MDTKRLNAYKLPYLILCGVISLFALFYLYKQEFKPLEIVVGLVSLVLFLVILWEAIIKLVQYWFSPLPKIEFAIEAVKKRNVLKTWALIACGVIAFHIFIYIVGYAVARISGRLDTGFFESMYKIWCKCGIDAPSYLGIAENWYVTSGDPMYHIVFFPFYPIVIKAFSFIFRDYFVSAIAVSIFSSIGMAITGYELVRLEFSEKTAKYFVVASFLLFGSFFYGAAMTESLFVFLCLLCLYFTKKRNFVCAGIFGALAGFTRSPGILLMVPVGIEYIRVLVEKIKFKPADSKITDKQVINFIADGFAVLFISMGLIAYLLVNYSVWGNAFQFSIFQKEHWGQQMGFFFRTVSMIAGQFYDRAIELNADSTLWDIKRAFALWLPQLVLIFGSLGVINSVK